MTGIPGNTAALPRSKFKPPRQAFQSGYRHYVSILKSVPGNIPAGAGKADYSNQASAN
jgi:hypothetical protein